MIDLKNLRAMIRMMVEADLMELDLQDAQGERVTLKRGPGEQAGHPLPAGWSPMVGTPPPGSMPGSASSPASGHSLSGSPMPVAAGGPAVATPAEEPTLIIASPMVGTFYTSATPETKPFVNPGDHVTPDTVVCIIEAMKVFNEIKAEQSGIITRVAATNGKAVEFGQPLFILKPE